MDNMLRDSKHSSPSWVFLSHSQAARTWGEAVVLNPENCHSDLASSNLCIFENCSSHLPPLGSILQQLFQISNSLCVSWGPSPVVL